jgi:hypothetical protein
MMPPSGSKVTVTHGGVTTTATYVGLISVKHEGAGAYVILDGTEQPITVPRAWILERR